MLYVIGLGLSDEKDITVKGLEVGRACGAKGRVGQPGCFMCSSQPILPARPPSSAQR